MAISSMLRPLDLENSIFPEDGRDFSGKLKVKHKVSCFLKNYNVIIRALDVIVRPVSNVVLLPCGTQLIELNSTLAWQ